MAASGSWNAGDAVFAKGADGGGRGAARAAKFKEKGKAVDDVPQPDKVSFDRNFPLRIPTRDGGEFHEDIEVFGSADREAEDGLGVAQVCRKAGISQAGYFNWKRKYAGLMPSEVKRLRQLEEENAKLKRIVADLALDKAMLEDVLSKKL